MSCKCIYADRYTCRRRLHERGVRPGMDGAARLWRVTSVASGNSPFRLAHLVEHYQPEGDIRNRLICWRTWQTVALTAVHLLIVLLFQSRDWWEPLTKGVELVCLFAIFWSMMATFALRKIIVSPTEMSDDGQPWYHSRQPTNRAR